MTYKTDKSKELFQQAQRCLVGGISSSFHKAPWNDYPIYMDHGEGARVFDVDGNSYIDYLNAFGPNILGYVHPALTEAVEKQLKKATLMAAPNADLVKLANKLVDIIPCADKVSAFMSSGSEANMHAIRVARAYTGKKKIVKIEGCYHGSMDEEKVSCDAEKLEALGSREHPNKIKHIKGQKDPDDIIIAMFNDLDNIEHIFKTQGDDIACMILETIMANADPIYPKPGFLEGLRKLCDEYKVVLIFDEVITGFRLGLQGAQGCFGVTPDLATFGKAIGGGYPISCVVGREEVVTAATVASGTFAANALCVAAALATIETCQQPDFYENLERMSKKMIDGIEEICAKHGVKVNTKAIGGMWTMILGTDEELTDYRDHYSKVDSKLYTRLVQGCMERGIRLNPWRGRNYMCAQSTDDDIDYTLRVIDEVMAAAVVEK
ncbi:aspartate aminotransferase family protein [Anaerovorax odorimutans]|uniref:Aspartate aminotransferase family protein n=1 Tax=Anaerovorax odorimutans TaxID=109327 RepID=A0ABT1RRN5_9FIRM|nr:aspartate aminotransferase family protein [Anaerovorax odorimutans]MCQ4637858.1 aspartate aminotransferase family protein [Anaerovorax odorimutans]